MTELTADPTALPTAEVTSPRGLLATESSVGPADPGLATAEAADVTDDACAAVFWSWVAAWACLVKISRRKRIPAATIANCATRTVTRCANSCDIDSSHPLTNWTTQAEGQKGPGQAMQDR
jgi:hypothetical protein